MFTARTQLHRLAKAMLSEPDQYIRGFSIGRLLIMWDTGKPVPDPVPSSELIPDRNLYHD